MLHHNCVYTKNTAKKRALLDSKHLSGKQDLIGSGSTGVVQPDGLKAFNNGIKAIELF